jgi:hypothetical protein
VFEVRRCCFDVQDVKGDAEILIGVGLLAGEHEHDGSARGVAKRSTDLIGLFRHSRRPCPVVEFVDDFAVQNIGKKFLRPGAVLRQYRARGASRDPERIVFSNPIRPPVWAQAGVGMLGVFVPVASGHGVELVR